MFGGVDMDYVASNFTFFSVIPGTFWELQLEGIKIGNTSINVCERLNEDAGKCVIAVDSGTSLIAGPSEFISLILDTLAVAEDCSNYKSLPTVTLSIEGKDFVLEAEDYVIKENETEYVRFLSNADYSSCAPTFMALDVPRPRGPIFVLGASFLKRFYTVFDRKSNLIGFAKSKLKNDPARPSTENIVNPYSKEKVETKEEFDVNDVGRQKEEVLKKLENNPVNNEEDDSPESMIKKIEALGKSYKDDLLLVSQIKN